MSRVYQSLRLGSRALHQTGARGNIQTGSTKYRYISTTRPSFATPTTRPITRPSPPPPPPPSQQVPESIYRRQTTTAALYLLSLLGALGAGYALNLIIDTPTPNIQYTLIDCAKAKAYQLENQPTYGSLADYTKAISEIESLFKSKGKGDKVSTDESDLESHGISDWSYHEEKRPTVVVWVESTEEVVEIVRIATKYRVPITPFSGGTSLEGHFSSVSQEGPLGPRSRELSLSKIRDR
jgi:D-lactate dehydrogenase (cytochrome)